MHQEKYWASKVPLPMALLFLANILVILAVQILVFYRYPAAPEPASLAKYDPVYASSRILAEDSRNYLTASLVETTQSQPHLVVTKAHPIAYARGRILYAEPLEIPASKEQTVYVKNGIHTAEIAVGNTGSDFPWVDIRYGYNGSIWESATLYLLLAALLEGMELVFIYLIKK